jgi:predicted XRE-type DNA-binding protein
LDSAIMGVSNNFDFVFAVTGMEGSAKSSCVVLSMTYIAHKLGITFNHTDVCFNVEQLDEKIDKSQPGSLISLDEFVLLGSSEDTMTKLQKVLRKKFTLIRKKRLFIFLVMPSIHMMNKYFCIARIRGLINCKVYNFQRGYATFYAYDKKNYMAVVGRKNFTYLGFKNDGTFKFIDVQDINVVKNPVMDWEAYEKRKDDAISSLKEDDDEKKEVVEKDSKRMIKLKAKYWILINKLIQTGMKQHEISSLIGISRQTISQEYDSYKVFVEKYKEEKGIV